MDILVTKIAIKGSTSQLGKALDQNRIDNFAYMHKFGRANPRFRLLL